MTDPIRILLAEDQGMVRDALATLLGMEPDMEVIHRLSSGDGVVQAATALRPDVALLDIEMPGTDGLTAAADLHCVMPECRILILTTFVPRLPASRHDLRRLRIHDQGRSGRGARAGDP